MSDKKELNILHLYPDLLNLYGDKGNIACMDIRLKARGIETNITEWTKQKGAPDIKNADIIFLGGGSDREQELVCSLLLEKKNEFSEYVENGGVLVALCGGFQMIGKYYQTEDSKVEGLGLLDIYTEPAEKRFIGNVILESELFSQKIVGFENHAGKTYTGNHKPLGRVLCGYGSTGESETEGVVYKNVFASYLHGPLLPKNPMLCDYILECAMKHKFSDFVKFDALDDSIENKANEYIVKTFLGSN